MPTLPGTAVTITDRQTRPNPHLQKLTFNWERKINEPESKYLCKMRLSGENCYEEKSSGYSAKSDGMGVLI